MQLWSSSREQLVCKTMQGEAADQLALSRLPRMNASKPINLIDTGGAFNDSDDALAIRSLVVRLPALKVVIKWELREGEAS